MQVYVVSEHECLLLLKVWFSNVPHTQLVSYKADQNWVKVSKDGKKLIFPGGGTQFKHGATHYIDFLEQSVPEIAWGRHTRVILDVGCGVASFGGYLFDRDVLAMSVAPKDEHEARYTPINQSPVQLTPSSSIQMRHATPFSRSTLQVDHDTLLTCSIAEDMPL